MRQILPRLVLIAALACTGIAQSTSVPLSSAASQAPVPRFIRFSGQIKASAGTVGVTFTLHKQQQDNVTLWTETQNVKVDAEGRYSVLLGATKSEGVPAELFASGEAQWLGIRVEGQAELPRVLLVSVPYAMKAAEAETLAGHSASEFVTSEKLSTVVQEQIQQQQAAGGTSASAKKSAAAKGNVVTNTATNFTDNTTNQVVLVTQNGTGSGLVANVVSGNGVSGSTTSAAGIGAAGINTAASGVAVGLRGSTVSGDGIAIYGTSTGTSGAATGIKGITAAPGGYGVFAQNTAATGPGIGLRGTSASTSGTGIYGTSTAATGATIGVRTSVASASGTSAVFQNTAGGKIFSGQSGIGNTEVFSVDGSGNTTTAGQFKSTVTTGTAPLSVASTTVVPNLNASLLQGLSPNAFAQLNGGVTQWFSEGINANGATSNSPGGVFLGGTDQAGIQVVAGTSSGTTGSAAGTFTGADATSAGGPGVQSVGGSGATGGGGGNFMGGAGTQGGVGVSAKGGVGSGSAGGLGGVFYGGTSDTKAGAGIQANGAAASGNSSAGEGVQAYGGNGSATNSPASGIAAVGGGSTFPSGYGGLGASLTGGYASPSSGSGYGGTGAYIKGGGTSLGTGGDALWATPGVGTFGTAFAARFFGQIEVNSPNSSSTMQMHLGDPGCGASYFGLGFGLPTVSGSFTLASCTNYNMISNGTDLLLNVPSGGAMYFRQANGTNMTITSSGNVNVAKNAIVGGTLLVTGNMTEFGSISVTHDVSVSGTLTAATKNFVIDHPVDPGNKLLYHTSIESPDMKDLYDGVVLLNAKGEAWVELPDYFEALNQDFRYTLTAIGRGAPYLHVAREIKGNRFKIAGGRANQKVSWQVTGIRHDAFAQANRSPIEVDKQLADRGKYLHPELYGASGEEAMTLPSRTTTGEKTLAQAHSPKQ